MTALGQYALPILIIALIVGVIIAFWAFRRRTPESTSTTTIASGTAPSQPRPAAPSRPATKPEGEGLADEYAAATENVAGEILGVGSHPAIPGPSGPPDNLQLLKGVGPKLAAQLNANGITRYDQLASLSDREVELLDERMGAFRGRIARDRLVEQACYLERNDKDGFEAKFGKLGG